MEVWDLSNLRGGVIEMWSKGVFTAASIIATASIILAQALKSHLPPATSTAPAPRLKSFLTQAYDLKPKYKKGAVRYQRLVIVYYAMDAAGHVVNRNEVRASIERRVESVLPDGKAYEQIAWKNWASRMAQGATGAYGPYQRCEWAEGFSYRFSAEDPHDKFHWNYEKFPKTMQAYLILMHTVDAHFEFDYLRSSYHGAIEKLRRIGDEVEAPDSHQRFTINFPPLVPNSYLDKKDVYTKFIGLTVAGGEPCAILAHRQGPGDFWLDFAVGSEQTRRSEITSTFAGNLYVRLSDGSLVHGDFVEWVSSKMAGPSPERAIYAYTRGDYSIDEISREEYVKGIGDSAK